MFVVKKTVFWGLLTGIPNPDKPEKKTFNHDGNNGAQPCKEHRPGGKS
jgi:hypothetical protein